MIRWIQEKKKLRLSHLNTQSHTSSSASHIPYTIEIQVLFSVIKFGTEKTCSFMPKDKKLKCHK